MKFFFNRKRNEVTMSPEDIEVLADRMAVELATKCNTQWSSVMSSINSLPKLLALSGVKDDSLVRVVIDWYLKACEDVVKIEACTQEHDIASLRDIATRMRRVRNDLRYGLEQLGVDVHYARCGESFDRTMFRVEQSVPTDDVAKHACVAEFVKPAFTWVIKDQKAIEPGSVIAYVLTNDAVDEVAEATMSDETPAKEAAA